MDFSEFEKRIVKVKKMDLPGEAIQFKMAPVERLKELKEQARLKQNARKAGVMALFYPSKANETHLILILRKTYKGVHSAQVGFPGGKIEPEDDSLEEAALRETEEEVGVSRKVITVLKELTEIYIPPSNFSARHWPRALECGLRASISAPNRWALWPKPKPWSALLSTTSHVKTIARRPTTTLPRLTQSPRHQSLGA